MRWINALILVFSTYTRLPVPKAGWDAAMSLAIAFLPLVGAVIGGVVWAWQFFCRFLDLSPVLFAAGATALPIYISGGIHLDGYCDTADALASWQTRERRLEILKDPHLGAFALIRFGVYLLVNFALLYELFARGHDAGIGFIYGLSRCLAAWSVISMPNARKDGMLVAFAARVEYRTVGIILALLSALGLAGWLWLTCLPGLAGLVLCLPLTLWYRGMARKYFGGVTSDTTGYYLQLTELALFAGLLIGGLAFGV